MKTKASALFGLLLFAMQSALFGQAADCYDYQCPSKIFAPCEGSWGARVWYSVNATNRCDPSVPPTVTYSVPPGSIFPPGTNVVCATIQIPGLPPRNCCWDVIVDNCCSSNCIEVICPRDIVVACQQTPIGPGAFVDVPPPRATNHCGDHVIPSTWTWRCMPGSQTGQPNFYPPGTNHVVCCLVDGQGNIVACCCYDVVVTNCPPQTSQCKPEIICPTAIDVQCEGQNGGIVFFPPPTVNDPCHLVIATNITHTSGSFFPNGKTTVGMCIVWKDPATGATLTECCCFDVVVRCCPPPTDCVRVVCPTNMVVDCAGPNGAVVTFNAYATNFCTGGVVPVSCTPPSGSNFPPGVTTVCCTNATAGVVKYCCFDVTVRLDTVPPTITCPADMTVISPNCTPIDVQYPPPSASDNCKLDHVICTPPSGSPFPIGTTPVTCCAWDTAGNSNCCTFKITVRCQPPDCIRIFCPSNIVVDCAGPNGAVVTYSAYATNVCTGASAPLTCTRPSGSNFPIGVTTVCCTNNTPGAVPQWCCFDVTVRPDTVPPTIACPPDMTVISPNCTPMDVQYPPPHAADNCKLDHVTCTPPSGSSFPVGTTTVTCCAFDAAGNSSCCTFKVTVRCEPTDCVRVFCPSNIVEDCGGPNGAVVTFSAYATNTCTGGPAPITCTPPSGSNFPLGITTVCCTNITGTTVRYCCFDVTVRPDTVPPTITCPPDMTVISPNCTPIDVQYPPPQAADNCKLDHVTCTPPSNSPFPVGITTVTCCAYDTAGNSNCCTFRVTVRCEDCIRVFCPSNIVEDCGGPNGAVVTFNAYATNTCTGGSAPITCTPPSGSNFPLGTTTVCCTNITGTQVRYCCFDVTVRPDTIRPTIVCPPDMTVLSPNCTPIDVQYPPPSASDNCKIDHIICTPPSNSPFQVGTTTVTCCAWDTAGNSNCCTFKVTVRCEPNDCIRLFCSSNIFVDCAGPNGAVVTYNAYATNTCNGSSVPLNCSRPSGSVFPIGVTTVCCTNITANQVRYCCFDVTVRRDTVPPVINCPSNMYVLCAKPNGQKVAYNVTATDNCDPTPTVTCVPPSGSHFNLGCTNVTCVAVDDNGNATTCTFKVCLLEQGCYLYNPSFELLRLNLPAPLACGDPINYAQGWVPLVGTPDLWRPPFASVAPGNCRGRENPCHGTNYAGLEGGYNSSGGFNTEEMMGTLIASLNNGKQFRLRACLSLAESSPGPVLVEFVLANSANLAQQQVIHQVWVQQVNGWMQYLPPCFTVPQLGNWDRLIIRAAKVVPGTHPYATGYVYVDNVNICCCKPIIHTPVLTDTTVTVVWEGRGQLQATAQLGDPSEWHDVMTPVEYDPESDTFRTTMPRSRENSFFRIASPDGGTIECSECESGGGGGGAGGS